MKTINRIWPIFALLILPGFHHSSIGTQGNQDQDIPVIRNESGPVCDGPVFELIPHMVLGKDEGRPEWQIFPRGVGVWAVGPEDRIYVATSDYEIYIVSNRGRLIGKFGGYGDGPGEFRGPTGFYWIEDDQEFWLDDNKLYRLTRFSPDGELLGIISYHNKAEQWRGLIHLRGRRFLGMQWGKFVDGKPHTSYGLLNDNLDWERDALLVANPEPPTDETQVSTYQPQPPWVVSFPDGRFVLGRAAEGSLTYYSIDGTPLFRVEGCFEFPRVTTEDRDRFLRGVERRRPQELPAARRAKLPERMGAFRWPYTDDSGRIWLPQQKYLYNGDDEVIGYKYYIIDRDGTLLGTQVFEFESNMIEIRGDFLYWSDPGGETGPRVRIYRLRPLY